jgi:hypothetical protein
VSTHIYVAEFWTDAAEESGRRGTARQGADVLVRENFFGTT